MENPRKEDGKINFDLLQRLRKLMAHELGHIVLHSWILSPCNEGINDGSEEEVECFANNLIGLRRDRNAEIYEDQYYEKI